MFYEAQFPSKIEGENCRSKMFQRTVTKLFKTKQSPTQRIKGKKEDFNLFEHHTLKMLLF